MTRSNLRRIAIIRRVWRMIDWPTVGAVAADGIRAAIALSILCAIYSAEGVKSFYRWAQPRLASLLEHPGQTIKNGPSALYTESLAAVMIGSATVAEKAIVSLGAHVIMMGETLAKLRSLKMTANINNIRLQWGCINYSVVAWNGTYLSIWGQRMF